MKKNSKESVLEAVESSIAAAYKKNTEKEAISSKQSLI